MAIENPYFNLWKGQEISLNEVRRVSHGMIETVRTLVKLGKAAGQYTLEGDCLIKLVKEPKVIERGDWYYGKTV